MKMIFRKPDKLKGMPNSFYAKQNLFDVIRELKYLNHMQNVNNNNEYVIRKCF